MRAIALRRRVTALAAVAVLGLFGLALAPATAAPTVDFRPACDTATRPGVAACTVLVRTDVTPRSQAKLGPNAAPTNAGYGPASLQSAYLLPSTSAGTGRTVAIVDAYDYPSAEADLATYRADWGLPPCTSADGCFRKVNEHGQASPLPVASGSTGWATEEALDIDMVSAVCPNCHILLVEADSPEVSDLGTGVNSAVDLGAAFVSNSYGAAEYPDEAAADAAYYDHPGVAVTASAGDDGYGVGFPATSPHVVSVGGTSLTRSSDARGWAESAWSGSGSGCSSIEPKPSWQADSGCANRTNADVSAVADPNTGVAVYDTYDRAGWLEVGGTSVSSPIIASAYALVGPPVAGTYPANYLYAHTADLNDVTSGSNGSCNPAYLCTGEPGYDGPTGLGTPNGIGAFGAPSGNIVTVGNPGAQSATQDVAFSLQVRAVDSASGQTLGYSAAGLPEGLSIAPATGQITGTPTTVGSYPVTVRATDTTGASGSVSFTITVSSAVSFSGPGPQGGYVGQPALVPIDTSDAVAGRTLSYTASGLPPGLSIDSSTGVISGLLTTQGYLHATVTARDGAGRTNDDSFIWYVAPAQVAGRAGPVTLAGRCLDASGTAIALSACNHRSSQTWTVAAGGTLQTLGKCLTDTGTSMQLAACTGEGSQQWRIVSFGGLRNAATGECIDATNGVATVPCSATSGQRWVVPAGPLVSAMPGACADSGAGTTAQLQVWYCGATSTQAWTIQPDGTVRDGSDCLAVTGRSALELARCGGSAAQQWRVQPDGTVTSQSTGKCLADSSDVVTIGAPLVIDTCGAAIQQHWHIE